MHGLRWECGEGWNLFRVYLYFEYYFSWGNLNESLYLATKESNYKN